MAFLLTFSFADLQVWGKLFVSLFTAEKTESQVGHKHSQISYKVVDLPKIETWVWEEISSCLCPQVLGLQECSKTSDIEFFF